MKCSVFIAASVDGFIARPDGDVDWLHDPRYTLPEQTDFGYQDFISTVDAIVMGRNSFEKVLSFGGWYYEDMPVIVLSSGDVNIPEHLRDKVRQERGAPEDIVARLGAEDKQHLYIDGGVTIQRFLQAGLIDELTITRIPILLGSGIPLFDAIGTEILLDHVETQYWDNGLVQTRYTT